MRKKWIQLVVCSALLLFATVDGFAGCGFDLGNVTNLNCSSTSCTTCGWLAYGSCAGDCPCGYPNCRLEISSGQQAVGMTYDCYVEGSQCMYSNTDGEPIFLAGHCGCFNI